MACTDGEASAVWGVRGICGVFGVCGTCKSGEYMGSIKGEDTKYLSLKDIGHVWEYVVLLMEKRDNLEYPALSLHSHVTEYWVY